MQQLVYCDNRCIMALPAFLQTLQASTLRHQQAHGCNAHFFEDGEGLWQLVQQYQPQRILELGSGLGYTACLMALASPQARVDTLEGDAEHAALARQHIRMGGLEQRVHLHEGSFAVTLPAMQLPPRSLDFVFFDGNSPPLILIRGLHALLRHGGLLACANLEISWPQGSRRVKAELDNPQRWQKITTIENGQTQVVTAVHPPEATPA